MKPLPYVKRFTDRHGRARYYYRRKGWPSVTLPDPLKGMREFNVAYAAAEERRPLPMASKAPQAGTMEALIVEYLGSRHYADLAPASKASYGSVLTMLRMRESAKAPVAAVTPASVEKLIDELIAKKRKGMAALTLKVLKRLMKFAVQRNYRFDNPAREIDGVTGGAYRSWTDAELAKFEARWPRGTTERLIYELALYTGQRRGDIARMTWADWQGNVVHVTQQKTGSKVEIKAHWSLQAELDLIAHREGPIVVDARGEAYEPPVMAKRLMAAAKAAKLPTACKLHGLRKAATRRLAEAGCTDAQIMAVTGHQTREEVSRYTKGMNNRKAAEEAIAKLEVSNPVKPVAQDAENVDADFPNR